MAISWTITCYFVVVAVVIVGAFSILNSHCLIGQFSKWACVSLCLHRWIVKIDGLIMAATTTHTFSLYRFEPCTAHFTCSLAKQQQQQHRHHLCIICHWWDILCSCRHANDFLVSSSSITTASLVCWKTEKPKKKTRISILALMVSNLIMQRWVGW